MAEKEKTLTPEQRRAIVALLSAKNTTEAAKVAGVSERSLFRWLEDATFKAELNAAQADIMATATRRLTHAMNTAADVLVDVMEHGDTRSVKLRAALGLIGVLPSLVNTVNVETRLAALEAAQGGKGI
jgi:hypothetical protein